MEGSLKRVHEILKNCTEVLNHKYYFVKDIKIISKASYDVIVIQFDPRTSLLPKLFKNAIQDNQNGKTELSLYVIADGDAKTLERRALDTYIWSCCIPEKGSRHYRKLMREVKYNVNDFQDTTNVRRVLRTDTQIRS